MRFNPPPGWTVPDSSWLPDSSWTPDPSWPPAPPGWQFFIDEPTDVSPTMAAAPPPLLNSYPNLATTRPPAATRPASWIWITTAVIGVIGLASLGILGYSYYNRNTATNEASTGSDSGTAGSISASSPTEMTFGRVSFAAPAEWKPRDPTLSGSGKALVELAPEPDSRTSIAVWSYDTVQQPSYNQDALRAEGVAQPGTFAGRSVWTYKVTHTISSRGPGDYLLTWYILFDGTTRVDISCDSSYDDQARAALAPICEAFVASVAFKENTVNPTASQPYSPPQALPPPLVFGPDSSTRHETCTSYSLSGKSGWGTHAGRGTPETSCFFAQSVLEAYWRSYGNASPESRQISAAGSVACTSVTAATHCDGTNFIMRCEAYPGDGWITCTGGNNARVYLY